MRSLFIALLSFIVLSTVSAQQVVQDPNAQVRSVSAFHAIRVSTGIHLYLSQGSEQKVVVSSNDIKYRDRIKTEVKDGVLHIYYDHVGTGWEIGRKELNAYVSFSQLDDLRASSGAQVKVDGALKSTNLAIDLSSGAGFNGRVEAGALKMDGSSGSRAMISGTAASLKAEASSGSSIHGYDLQVDKCSVDVSSGARIDITVQKEMIASADSGGHISYQGSGVITDVHTGSGGRVSRNK